MTTEDDIRRDFDRIVNDGRERNVCRLAARLLVPLVGDLGFGFFDEPLNYEVRVVQAAFRIAEAFEAVCERREQEHD